MGKREIMSTRIGEMFEMIACDAIAHGAAPKRQRMSLDDMLNLR